MAGAANHRVDGVYVVTKAQKSNATRQYAKDSSHYVYHIGSAWALGWHERYYTSPSDQKHNPAAVPLSWAAACKRGPLAHLTVTCADEYNYCSTFH